MPVQLTWHPTLPVLIATYSGILLNREHREMVKGRQQMLDSAAGKVIMIADTREFEFVENVQALIAQENVFKHRHLRRTLIVLKPSVYHSNQIAIRDTFALDVPVLFFSNFDAAMRYAEEAASE